MLRVVSMLIIPALLVVLPAVGCKNTQPTQPAYPPAGYTPALASDMYPPPERVPAVANEWVCSMHPTFSVPQPGRCSLCGMDLVHVNELSSTQGSSSGSGHSHSSDSGNSHSSASGHGCCG